MAKNSYLAPVDPTDPTASVELNNPTLEEVQEQFFEWRKQRKFGARIPETLWSHALSLSNTFPVGQITRTLGLGWESYQKRLCQRQGLPYQPKRKVKPSPAPSPFIELKVSESDWSNLSLSPSPCLLEIANPSGGSLRIYASKAAMEVKCLASHILGLIGRRINQDWQQKYHHEIYMLETFVEDKRFLGTCCKAANWVYLGKTLGRGRNGVKQEYKLPIKSIWVYTLSGNFREKLRNFALPAIPGVAGVPGASGVSVIR